MDNETKKNLNERYQRELNKGEFFWPDSIFKDAIVSLGIFVLLILLASFVGVANEPKADPFDTSYLPRPEWYFLFLFKFLALYGQIPVIGKIEWLATVLVPTIGIGLLTLLPFLDKSPYRHYSRRVFALTVMGAVFLDIILLTIMAGLRVPETAEELEILNTLEAIGGLWIPMAVLVLLIVLYIAKRDVYHQSTRSSLPILITVVGAVAMIAMTGYISYRASAYPAPEETETAITLPDRILAGQDLYSLHCVECHGDDGKVTVIEGVEGLEGKQIMPINAKDVLYTLNDAALAEVIAYGRPDAGMNPFGKMYNPEGLGKSDIDNIVFFMRYMWDDRFETPEEVLKPLIPILEDGEVPSYDVHIAPLVKRYCISCHRAGKENNNYLMTTYEEILTTGDHADNNLVKGDANSYLLQVIQGHPITENGEEVIGVMPPKTTLKSAYVDVFIRWILAGMPMTAEDAAALFGTLPTPTPAP